MYLTRRNSTPIIGEKKRSIGIQTTAVNNKGIIIDINITPIIDIPIISYFLSYIIALSSILLYLLELMM